MAKQKVVPNPDEARILRTLANGNGMLKQMHGQWKLAGVTRDAETCEALLGRNWIALHNRELADQMDDTSPLVDCYVSSKRGRDALALCPPPKIAPVEIVREPDPRFGVVVRAK